MTTKTVLRAAMFAGLFALPCLMAPAWAQGGAGGGGQAPGGSRLEVALTLYAGGVTLGKMDLDATLRGNAYRAVSHLETSGVVNAFWQAQIQATSSGQIGQKKLSPSLYNSFDNNNRRKQEVSLTYEGASPRLYADPVYSTTGYEVKPEDQKETLDPLSAVMFIVSGIGGEAGNPCALTAPVFDGRRRYDIEMSKTRDIDIRMDNGLYRGKGVLCEIRYKQLAGFKPNVLRNRDKFPRIYAWVAPVKSGAREYTIPVRVWADTPYGVVAAVADSLKLDGRPYKSG